MKTNKEVRRLNELLARDLGDPSYGWVWSEDLLYIIQKKDPVTGLPAYDYQCACGTNVRVHDPRCESLIVPVPKYEAYKIFVQYKDVWILCRRMPHQFNEAQWRQAFGSQLPFEKSTWAPCIPIVLEPGEEPNQAITEHVIRCLREAREKTAKQFVEELQASSERTQKAHYDSMKDEIRDSIPAFGGIPGTKENWASFAGAYKDDTPLVVEK